MQEALPLCVSHVLEASSWKSQEAAHQARLAGWLKGYVYRRSSHHKDPVLDFLFEYYRFRPAQLLRWAPDLGCGLAGTEAQKFLEFSGFSLSSEGIAYLDPAKFPQKRLGTVRWISTLLAQTASKQPQFGCFGMHEWAMVYRAEEVRHQQIPLRLSTEDIATFVESRALSCTHFDAWRFFTDLAKPRNRFALSRDNQEDMEQPGCLHANMDLYKWTYKLFPWVPAELLADAFSLAMDARYLDMQASPYDLQKFDIPPIRVETPEGREEYRIRQEQIFERAAPLRARLLQACERLLQWVETQSEGIIGPVL